MTRIWLPGVMVLAAAEAVDPPPLETAGVRFTLEDVPGSGTPSDLIVQLRGPIRFVENAGTLEVYTTGAGTIFVDYEWDNPASVYYHALGVYRAGVQVTFANNDEWLQDTRIWEEGTYTSVAATAADQRIRLYVQNDGGYSPGSGFHDDGPDRAIWEFIAP